MLFLVLFGMLGHAGIIVEGFYPTSTCLGLSFRSNQQSISSKRFLATSSSDLKNNRDRNKKSKNSSNVPSVVRRLKLAAERASQRKQQQQSQPEQPHPITSQQPSLGKLHDLTTAIDQQIREARSLDSLNRQVSSPVKDSMLSMLQHNQRASAGVVLPHVAAAPTTKHVAIVFSKKLVENQVSIEYALRIQRLVKAMKQDDYMPTALYFVGNSEMSIVSDSDAGLLYFCHLCHAQNVDVSNIDIRIDRTNLKDGALENIVEDVRDEFLEDWKDGIVPVRGRRVLRLEFDFFSSDYHLSNINDIHNRSPVQSPLRVLQQLRANDFILETSWRYFYATTVAFDSDPVQRLAKSCYRRAQDLIPVLQNLRGVVNNAEFFQRDNYRVLVQIRRSLISDMEHLYNVQPSLVKVSSKNRMDVILESALLNFGRCLDLVRPAGLLTHSVPLKDFELARNLLEQAISQVALACDPDQPLPPLTWGLLMDTVVMDSSKEEEEEEPCDILDEEDEEEW